MLFILTIVYFSSVAAVFYFKVHTKAHAWQSVLPESKAPTAKSRILVIAPHCDDETLGCGGLIKRSVNANSVVYVAIITNGDSFRRSAAWESRSVRLSSADYLALAQKRQQESVAAMALLGVPEQQIRFLDYPDRGLSPMWNSFWFMPYRSSSTGLEQSPDENPYRNIVSYRGKCLLDDLVALIREVKPTDIYVSHPMDDHPDHAAAAAFVNAALIRLQTEGNKDFLQTVIHTYLIHRGDWPLPQGLHPSEELLPPNSFHQADGTTSILYLSYSDEKAKEQALNKYESQMPMLGRFMTSFIRENELFNTQMPEQAVINRSIDIKQLSDWGGVLPLMLDPVDDDLLRHMDPAVDLRAVYLTRKDNMLYVRLDTNSRIKYHIQYRLNLRGFSRDFRQSEALTVTAGSWKKTQPTEVESKAKGKSWVFAIPLDLIGNPAHVAIYAETKYMGVPADRTATCFVKLNN